MCDVAHVLISEQLERQVVADWQAAAFGRVMGGEGDLPDLGSHLVAQRDAFLEALIADPAPSGADSEQMRLRRALGVA